MSTKKITPISLVTTTSLPAAPRRAAPRKQKRLSSFSVSPIDPVLKTTQLAFLEVNFPCNGQRMSVESLNTDDFSGAVAP